MIQQPFPMAPGSTLDFVVDWSSWLNAGDSLQSATAVAADTDVTLVGSPVVAGPLVTVKATLSPTAKLNKTMAALRVTGTTVAGLVDPRVIQVAVQVK